MPRKPELAGQQTLVDVEPDTSRSSRWRKLPAEVVIGTDECERLIREQNVRNHNALALIRNQYTDTAIMRGSSRDWERFKLRCDELGGHWPTVKRWLQTIRSREQKRL